MNKTKIIKVIDIILASSKIARFLFWYMLVFFLFFDIPQLDKIINAEHLIYVLYILAITSTLLADISKVIEFKENNKAYCYLCIKQIIFITLIISLKLLFPRSFLYKIYIVYLLPIPIILLIINIAYYAFYRICKRIDEKE